MKKNELIELVAEQTGESKASIEKVLNGFAIVLKDAVKADDKVLLPGIGTFELSIRAPRQGINPATGEKLSIGEKRVPKFKAIKAFKEYL